MTLHRLAGPALVLLVGTPAFANDPDPTDAAETGQVAPAQPPGSRDFALPRHDEAATACWTRAAGRRGAPLTRVTVDYRVRANGRVQGARIVEPARPTAAARRCVLAALRAHRFPDDEVRRVLGDRPLEQEVHHTFVLERVDAEQAVVAGILGSLVDASGPSVSDLLGGVVSANASGQRPAPSGGLGLGSITGWPVPDRHGVVRVGRPTVRGALARPVVDGIIHAAVPELLLCYDSARATAPDLAGRLAVRMTVDAQGAVTDVTLAPEGPASPALRRCVADRLATSTFPARARGAVVIVDFALLFTAP